MISLIKRILLLSPHTDDAEIGAGGSIIKFIEEGKQIFWVVFSTAEESLPKELPQDALKEEFLNVVKSLDLEKSDYEINHFKVRHLHESRQEILEKMIKIRDQFQPNLVIGPSINDVHQDHQIVAYEMIRAFKMDSSIISYELPWNHLTFNTQLFIKLQNHQIKRKVEMLKFYESQLLKKKRYFSEKYISGLARVRGVQINADFAEAFEVIKWII